MPGSIPCSAIASVEPPFFEMFVMFMLLLGLRPWNGVCSSILEALCDDEFPTSRLNNTLRGGMALQITSRFVSTYVHIQRS